MSAISDKKAVKGLLSTGLKMPQVLPKADRPTFTLLLVVLIATMGTWFPMGYIIVAMNGPQTVIVNWIRSVRCIRLGGAFGNATLPGNGTSDLDLWCMSIAEEEEPNILQNNPELNRIWAVGSSVLNVGGLISTFTCTFSVNRFGLKGSLLISAGILICGTLVFCLAPLMEAYEMLIAGRFFIGFALGLICVITPMYTSELTPVSLRGAIGTIPVVMYVAGLITSTVMGLPMILGNNSGWPILVGLQLIPVVLLCFVLPFCPDSPRRLFITKHNLAAAEKALRWLRSTSNVHDELHLMQEEANAEKKRENVSFFAIFKDPFLRSTILICAVPMMAQQFSGYSCVSFYSTSIFNGIGLTRLNSIYVSLGLWATFLTFSLISMVLVDRAGRRMLLLISHALIMLALLLFVILMTLTKYGFIWTKYGSAACVLFFIAAYASAPASVPWILPSEMFTQEARPAAMTIIGAVCWASALLTTLLFPVVVTVLQEFTFSIFILLVALATAHIYFKLPETKGKTIEEIQFVLRQRFQ